MNDYLYRDIPEPTEKEFESCMKGDIRGDWIPTDEEMVEMARYYGEN